jgi:dihydrolipoamide dehydrogenase
MRQKVDVIIIGAGSAGLSALRQVKGYTDNYLIIDQGPLGTKCARVGCMPSKALINVAKDFYRRKTFLKEGIIGADKLRPDIPAILNHIRKLRDHFTNEMIKTTKHLAEGHLIIDHAEIISHNHIRIGNQDIETDKIIIATGSKPKMPEEWLQFGDRILTSDTIFEQQDLPRKIAVVGLGPIGLELGQALCRLGIDITGFTSKQSVAKTTNPNINDRSTNIFSKEFPIYFNASVELDNKNGTMLVKHPEIKLSVDTVLVAIGIEPYVQGLGLENLGLELNKKGLPRYDHKSSKINDLSVFIAGDVNDCRPILHEALDEGFIAGRNSLSADINSYCRRTPLHIVFSDPQIAMVGRSYTQLKNSKKSFVIGKAEFTQQSRAVLELRNQGLIHIYVDDKSGRFLGAELICPDAEHLAHFLAVAIQNKLTVVEMLQVPFYHPTVEEALRTAMQDAIKQLVDKVELQGLSLCESCPESVLT